MNSAHSRPQKDPRLHGLYAITDARERDPQNIITAVAQALLGGARIVQYRDKSSDHPRRLKTAQRLREITHQHDALLIINDDTTLASA